MARKFEGTAIAVNRSRDEIEAIIAKHGGGRVQWLSISDREERVVFHCYGRWLVFPIRYGTAREAPAGSPNRARWAERDRMRAYRLTRSRIGDRFEEYREDPDVTFEEAFMANLLLPDGRTGADAIGDLVGARFDRESMPPLAARIGDAFALPARVGATD